MSDKSSDGFLQRLFHPGKPDSIEDLENVIDDARRREIISRNAEDMIKGVFDVSRQRVSEIMIPRHDMVTIQADLSIEDAARIISEHGHSRYPVISEDKDHIEGILLAKDLLPVLAGIKSVAAIRDLLRPAVIVPESKHVSSMLKEFQNKRFHIAVVVDEFGGVSGLITIEDILELIVGDIDDEYDDEDDEQSLISKAREKETYIIKGITPIKDFEEYFNITLPDVNVDTFAGLILHVLGSFPQSGTRLTIRDFDIEVLQAGEHRINLLKVIRKTPQ